MKKIIIIFVFIAKCHILFSQEENLVVFFVDAITNVVPVYSNDTDNDSITNIIEYAEKENWHDVEILGQSNNRYKVHITSSTNENVESIIGWVDRERCGVWLHGKYMKKELFIISLYSKPGQSNPFIRLQSKFFGDFERYTNGKAAPVLDYKLYNGEYWIKTVIVKDKKEIIGWTKDYCPNVYDSCN